MTGQEGTGRVCAPPTPKQVDAGAMALWDAFPTLREDFTPDFFHKAARIVLEAGELAALSEIIVATEAKQEKEVRRFTRETTRISGGGVRVTKHRLVAVEGRKFVFEPVEDEQP